MRAETLELSLQLVVAILRFSKLCYMYANESGGSSHYVWSTFVGVAEHSGIRLHPFVDSGIPP